ncbi:ornithine carbamoyltransferase [Christensenellaceae bacterium NSJ-63]|uniref:Ornithine carbamoyltransferase n=1 Tax=Guopingia tenuis TaxID=2763656 RepID=A0A926HVQ5_9FIRM|nr:ornithine carbamoyltransferase [Guopingia tenuis]MBC8537558.1 ornithine carbamoyltransferase [Guopingia tenuis]
MDLKNYQAKQPFSQKHLLTLADYSQDEILQILSLSLDLKEKTKKGIPHPLLAGQTLAMIFAKSSTRTRVSFEVGMFQLGGHALNLSTHDIQLGRGETVADTARTISRMVDGIMIRTFDQKDLEILAECGSVPVINGLTDTYHPVQALADVQTIYEHKGTLEHQKLAFVGDGNNVAHSLMLICTKLGMDFSIACPVGFEPDPAITKVAMGFAEESGAHILVTHDPREAAKGADAMYTDVWASMGQESQFEEKSKHFIPYQVNDALLECAKDDVIFMHCLPAHRGEEVTASVIDGPHSVVFDEAENRLHAQKAVMVKLMGKAEQ